MTLLACGLGSVIATLDRYMLIVHRALFSSDCGVAECIPETNRTFALNRGHRSPPLQPLRQRHRSDFPIALRHSMCVLPQLAPDPSELSWHPGSCAYCQ
jgi:hypothetical protein